MTYCQISTYPLGNRSLCEYRAQLLQNLVFQKTANIVYCLFYVYIITKTAYNKKIKYK